VLNDFPFETAMTDPASSWPTCAIIISHTPAQYWLFEVDWHLGALSKEI